MKSPFSVRSSATRNWVTLSLAGRIGIAEAADLCAALQDRRSNANRLRIRCQELEALDTTALQILYASSLSYEEACVEEKNEAWRKSFARAALPDPFETLNKESNRTKRK